MFYSETILSRRGPLGKVWLAAHMERKLSKAQTLQTDIEQSVDAIMGVVRIYSRKAKYLLDDCNEALLKIKMAFRPGVVDMTEDQLVINKTAITLQAGDIDLDILLPDVNWDMDFEDRPLQPQGHHQAHIDDITLRTADDFQHFDLNDPFDIGPTDGIGSQDLDLGINWDEHSDKDAFSRGRNLDEMSVDGSVGVARDAASRRDSIASIFRDQEQAGMDIDDVSNHSKSRELSETFAGDMNMDFPDLEGMDLGEWGVGFEDPGLQIGEKTPRQTRSPSRASSPLTEAPVTPPGGDLQDVVQEHISEPVPHVMRKAKERKQIIDSITELEEGLGVKGGRGRVDGFGAPFAKDVSEITTEQHFLPRSSIVMRLLEIREDPLAHFLPHKSTPDGVIFCAAPPDLIPELTELFMQPLNKSLNHKRRGPSPEKGSNKRPRLDDGEDDAEVEVARREGSLAPSVAIASDIFRKESLGPDTEYDLGDQTGVMDDYQLDVPVFDGAMENIHDIRERSKSLALTDKSRLSTPGHDEVDDDEQNYADVRCPIAVFDHHQVQSRNSEEDGTEGKGYSRNTLRALGLIRKELQPVVGEGVDKVISFRKMSDKASRRAAASFFFELLVLGTRDCIQVRQDAPFENIEVRAKAKLWEQQMHDIPALTMNVDNSYSRATSVARSTVSSMDL
ncbi:Rec8 like protein-domain-containing protein [Cyathus striatus]|nr:Rec8 like protein-domain-containing protein [Cyathus striatus]